MGFCTTLRRNAALPLAAALLAACETAAPAPFDPAIAAADVALLAGAFDTPLTASLDFAATAMDSQTAGDTPSTLLSASRGILLAGGELPASLAGTTFAFDESAGSYVATGESGAPPGAVRF
ncbi:MAG TPA: hypothetical protein VF037_08635, partial [Gemmatimonadales bacterium]